MNILIKLTCLIGLVIAPILGDHSDETGMAVNNVEVEITVKSDMATGTMNYSVIEDGIVTDEVQTFKGSEAEVNDAIKAFEATLRIDRNKQVIVNEVIISKM